MPTVKCPQCRKSVTYSRDADQVRCVWCAASISSPDDEEDAFDFEPSGGGGRSAARNRSGESNGFLDFLTFRRMVVPILIQIVFWLGVLAVIAVFIVRVRYANEPGSKAWEVSYGLGILLLWRGACELYILFFRMNETLTLIRNELRRLNRQ